MEVSARFGRRPPDQSHTNNPHKEESEGVPHDMEARVARPQRVGGMSSIQVDEKRSYALACSNGSYQEPGEERSGHQIPFVGATIDLEANPLSMKATRWLSGGESGALSEMGKNLHIRREGIERIALFRWAKRIEGTRRRNRNRFIGPQQNSRTRDRRSAMRGTEFRKSDQRENSVHCRRAGALSRAVRIEHEGHEDEEE